LSNKGVPFRKAHEIVGNAVRLGLDKGVELNDLALTDLQALSGKFAEDFYAAISLARTIDCHDVPGGTARDRVDIVLQQTRTRLASLTSMNNTQEAAAVV
jgi:argininosuccinate lyase